MGAVTATVTVQFANSAGSAQLSAEVDNREGGPNEGKTSFNPGDDVYLLVRKSPDVTVAGYCTIGNITKVGAVTGISEEQMLTFPRTRSADLSQTPEGGVTFEWFGSVPGTPAVKGRTVTLTGAYDKDNPPIGVAKATYTSGGESWKLSGIPATVNGKSSFEVMIVFVGTVAD